MKRFHDILLTTKSRLQGEVLS